MDAAAAARFLLERFGHGVRDVQLLGRGDWSRAFSFNLDDRSLVVRFGRHLADFQKDQQAMAFAGPDLPVPAVLDVGEASDGYYAISERHFGVFLEALDAPQWGKVLPALLRTLDALRDVRPPGSGVDWANTVGAAPVGWTDWLSTTLEDRPGDRVTGWRAKMERTPAINELFTRGEGALCSRLPSCPEIRHLVHRDLLNRNVLIAPDASRLAAVFDWGCSVAGDFLYEVAWFTFWSAWYPALASVDLRHAVATHYRATGMEVENFDRRLACYELHIGLEHLAYATFNGRDQDLHAIARRTTQTLERLSRAG